MWAPSNTVDCPAPQQPGRTYDSPSGCRPRTGAPLHHPVKTKLTSVFWVYPSKCRHTKYVPFQQKPSSTHSLQLIRAGMWRFLLSLPCLSAGGECIKTPTKSYLNEVLRKQLSEQRKTSTTSIWCNMETFWVNFNVVTYKFALCMCLCKLSIQRNNGGVSYDVRRKWINKVLTTYWVWLKILYLWAILDLTGEFSNVVGIKKNPHLHCFYPKFNVKGSIRFFNCEIFA